MDKSKITLQRMILACIILAGAVLMYLEYQRYENRVDSNYVIQQCEMEGNGFPNSKLTVEIFDYQTPFQPNVQRNDIFYSLRFENVSGQPMKMNFTIFYDTGLDKDIMSKQGIFFDGNDNLILDDGVGYRLASQLPLTHPVEKYSKIAQNRVNELSSKLYVEMVLDKEKHYFILDFANKEAISKLP